MNLHDALARLQAVAVPIPITEPHAATQIAATPPAPNLCRYCRETITWRRPGALAFGDHSSAHVLCYEQAEVARILAAAQPAVESPVALTDPAELTLCMPTAEAMLDAQVADKAAQSLGQMAAELVKPPVDRLQGLACAEPSMERCPSYTMFFPSIDCAPATTLGLTCQAERDWPSGMVVHPEREAWRRLLVPIEMAFRMPHVPLAATVAEEIGKAKSSTKLRGPGISLQFTHTDRTVTVVRLWAT